MASPRSLTFEIAFFQAFLANLAKRLGQPTEMMPTTACWTMKGVESLFQEIRKELKNQGFPTSPTNRRILDWLTRNSLHHEVQADGATFHVFELGASNHAPPDSLEILMASVPSGVVSYFSAISFHELTTQIVPHHHIARLIAPSNQPRIAPSRSFPSKRPDSNVEKSDQRKLGRLLFRLDGIPYYVTLRNPRLVPGIEIRNFGVKSLIRITTLEQTLVDSLFHPYHCGGSEVVFEAWNEAHFSDRLDDHRLVEYLEKMNYPATTRRVAAMFRVLGRPMDDRFHRFVASEVEKVDRGSPYAKISLLPGFSFSKFDPETLVYVP